MAVNVHAGLLTKNRTQTQPIGKILTLNFAGPKYQANNRIPTTVFRLGSLPPTLQAQYKTGGGKCGGKKG